jgi:hypothetical protein
VSYNNSYGVVLARTVDILLCGWIWRDYDITISSMAGLAMRAIRPPLWAHLLHVLLNRIQANHCELAIQADIERCQQALKMLNG